MTEAEGGKPTLRCVCGDPIELMDENDPVSWIHSPGSDTPCLDARPYEEAAGAAWRAESHRIAERKIREAVGGLYAEVGFRVMDALDGVQRPADQGVVLSDAERTMLVYALDQAQEKIWSEGGFTDEDQAAVDSLRRMAEGWARNPGSPQR